jgi:hypothetical protein
MLQRKRHGAPWTADEDALLRALIAAGSSPIAIAGALHRSLDAVAARVRRLGLALPLRPSCLTGRMTTRWQDRRGPHDRLSTVGPEGLEPPT